MDRRLHVAADGRSAARWRLAPKRFVAGRRFLNFVVFRFLDLVVGLGGPQDFFLLAPLQFLLVGRRFLDLRVFRFLDLVVGQGGPQDFFFFPQWHFLPVGRRFLDLGVCRFLNLVVGQGGPQDFFFFPLLQFFLGLPLQPLCPSGGRRRGHAHHLVRHLVCFLFEFVAPLVHRHLRLHGRAGGLPGGGKEIAAARPRDKRPPRGLRHGRGSRRRGLFRT